MAVEKKTRGSAGFSMIELMVVIVIGLVIAALAIPSVSNAITTIRLRESVSGVGGVVQSTRIEAVRTNRIQVMRMATTDNAVMIFNDVDQDDAYTGGGAGANQRPESVVQLAQGVAPEFAVAPPEAFPATKLLGYAQGVSTEPFNIAFNPRGLPCEPSATTGAVASCTMTGITTATGSSSGYLYYFRMQSAFGDRWAALTVSPAGRVRVWTLSGSDWN